VRERTHIRKSRSLILVSDPWVFHGSGPALHRLLVETVGGFSSRASCYDRCNDQAGHHFTPTLLTIGGNLKTRFAFLMIAALAGCASEKSQVEKASATAAITSTLTRHATASSSYTDLISGQSRLPSAIDFDVAWDEIAHRGNMRWECRGVPSGKLIASSLCADKPMVDLRWPDKKAPPNYSGVIVAD
jgi:hypothetical protein